jgi:NitT/TauT family transport system ATP-binding protein
MRQPAATLTGISKTYRSESGSSVPALRGLDLTVYDREILVLIGPTGCGKTTLLNILAGLDSPDSGEFVSAEHLGQGFSVPCVFQHYTLFPWRSLARNVTFGLEIRGVSRKRRRETAEELLANVGLSGFEHAYPHELSGGMRQRAAIAQALAVEPRMLLMDEPFGAVDDTTRVALQEMLTDIWRKKRTTIVFVTHNVDEAVGVADRVAVVSQRPGRVVREIGIPLPRPRDRMSPGFTELFLELRRALSACAPTGPQN